MINLRILIFFLYMIILYIITWNIFMFQLMSIINNILYIIYSVPIFIFENIMDINLIIIF